MVKDMMQLIYLDLENFIYVFQYLGQWTKDDLSIRDLRREIKSNSYERLINKPDKIDIIVPEKYSITTDMKNPIIIEVNKEIK